MSQPPIPFEVVLVLASISIVIVVFVIGYEPKPKFKDGRLLPTNYKMEKIENYYETKYVVYKRDGLIGNKVFGEFDTIDEGVRAIQKDVNDWRNKLDEQERRKWDSKWLDDDEIRMGLI